MNCRWNRRRTGALVIVPHKKGYHGDCDKYGAKDESEEDLAASATSTRVDHIYWHDCAPLMYRTKTNYTPLQFHSSLRLRGRGVQESFSGSAFPLPRTMRSTARSRC